MTSSRSRIGWRATATGTPARAFPRDPATVMARSSAARARDLAAHDEAPRHRLAAELLGAGAREHDPRVDAPPRTGRPPDPELDHVRALAVGLARAAADIEHDLAHARSLAPGPPPHLQ